MTRVSRPVEGVDVVGAPGTPDQIATATAARPPGGCALLLGPDDDVAVATMDLPEGMLVDTAAGTVVSAGVPRGHKIAVRPVAAGAAVRKYGQSIGRATVDIAPGGHVHTHNLTMDAADRAYEFGTERVVLPGPAVGDRTFLGFHRADGRVGTRNFVGVLTSAN